MPQFAKVEGIPVPLADPERGMEATQIGPEEVPSVAADKTGPPPSRFSLKMTASGWRALQCVGMSLHFLASPRPPSPAFTKTVKSTLAPEGGEFVLHFYTPKGYDNKFLHRHRKYPAVINFHGGGFTLGNATDDARFARFVVEECNALFISVDYRLSPEHPFPTAVEDGADALLFVIRNASHFHINPMLLSTSGFSAGGNLAVTAPLRLIKYMQSIDDPREQIPQHRIVASALWYPITDYTLTRAERRAGAARPDQALPPYLTDLFDRCYLHPPDLDLADPCLSPSRATDELLINGVAAHVMFYTCEWDMLLKEGELLAKRLAADPINKDVHYKMIKGVAHGWDKSPNPMSVADQSEELYKECCLKLKGIFSQEAHRVDGALP
ncbi:hypothetical protein jhhlp_000778 [Lomentospora prolificans]|uniref:Alpha/beta hydrolase fold-3 domain-containing protein n=1 Tax=Lomentospora prolificans TaxID=41688 RepID=A0A2N3NJF5_9PEZI|nr:hypothetical protein jhhlp_000778 [Lomentospora prolificans]